MTEEDARLFKQGWIRIDYDSADAVMPTHLDYVFVIGDVRRGDPVIGYRYVDQLYYDKRYGFVANIGDDDSYGGLTHWMQSRNGTRHLHSMTFPDDAQAFPMNPVDMYRQHKFFVEQDELIARELNNQENN